MTRIRILPEVLSNKIAAGEVVERPASVVKELVENALDAGSSRILVEVEKGGRSLIRVTDNGIGMNPDDALLAIERYATSKIATDDDLFSIRTLGFRGEALPSIASVSRFVMESRAEDREAGTRIEIEGGKIRNVSEVGAPPGTMIAVSNLFFNTPARRKFMKTVQTEMGHIGDTLASLALGWPQVRFNLLHNGKTVKSWPNAPDALERVIDILGRDVRSEMVPLDHVHEDLKITGWISSPRITRTSSRSIYIFVNGRIVRDRMVQHALFRGYAGRLVKGQFPLAVLFLTLPPDQVDVNVHPAKSEVRFSKQKEIHAAVSAAAAGALQQADARKRMGGHSRPPVFEPESHPVPPLHASAPHPPEISEQVPAFPENREFPDLLPSASEAMPSELPPIPDSISESFSEPISNTGNASAPPPFPRRERPPAHEQEALWDRKFFEEMRVIGQFRNTYILCESAEGLILIDQHAAHERVLYEELAGKSETEKPRSQRLLMPETLDLNFSEAKLFEAMIPALSRLGMEAEPFGGNTFIIKTVPALLSGKPAADMVREILEELAEIGVSAAPETVTDACIQLMACHGAIRANQSLSHEEIRALLKQLDACGNPSHCPHGRPTWIAWNQRFLEKAFHRVV